MAHAMTLCLLRCCRPGPSPALEHLLPEYHAQQTLGGSASTVQSPPMGKKAPCPPMSCNCSWTLSQPVGTTVGTSLLSLYALPETLAPDCSVHTFTDLGGYQCRSLPKVIWGVHFCPKYNEGFYHLHVIFLLGMEGEKNKQYPETSPTASAQGLLTAKGRCLKAGTSQGPPEHPPCSSTGPYDG